MKHTQTSYSSNKTILKFADHYVAQSVMVGDTGVVADSEGKKIVKAGTIVAGDPVVTTNTSAAEGVLFYDVDVTYGPAPGAMIIHGFIDLSKLPEAPSTDAKATLNQVVFM